MRVLVACEFSGIVRDAFIARGHDAVSCDLLPSERPGPHIQGDALEAVDRGGWDLLIAHPPCTYLANSGARWLYKGGRGIERDPERWAAMEDAARFFAFLLSADVPHVAVENPIMHGTGRRRVSRVLDVIPFDGEVEIQTVQPWWFGHSERKATQLWLRNLPPLTMTDDARPRMGEMTKAQTDRVHYASPGPDRWKERSRTYEGLAAAMAEQWGSL